MEIEGCRAVIEFEADIDLFRGEFVGLNGDADFCARDLAGLRREGAASLRVFSTCAGKTASSSGETTESLLPDEIA